MGSRKLYSQVTNYKDKECDCHEQSYFVNVCIYTPTYIKQMFVFFLFLFLCYKTLRQYQYLSVINLNRN